MKESEITLTITELKRLIKRVPTQMLVKDTSTWKTLGHECTVVVSLSDLYDHIDKLKKRKNVIFN
jgi:hypothetical protein